jgi:hypothetical protein
MILRVKTITGKYEVPVKNKLEAKDFLLTLRHMGITCVKWEYKKEENECSGVG